MEVLAILVLLTIGPAFPLAIYYVAKGRPEEPSRLFRAARPIARLGDIAALALALVVLL